MPWMVRRCSLGSRSVISESCVCMKCSDAGVMMPAYLAAIGGGRRMRVARLTAVYLAGVSLVVLPITLGAAVLASYVSRWHPQMFAIGGLMMLGVAVALWRGTMLPLCGKTMAHGTSLTRPHNSPLIKFPMRPKANPNGISGVTKSVSSNNGRCKRLAYQSKANIPAMSPP